jgi:hypothetical protein
VRQPVLSWITSILFVRGSKNNKKEKKKKKEREKIFSSQSATFHGAFI